MTESQSQYRSYAQQYDDNEMASRYNWKYRTQMRESDKRLIQLVGEYGSGRQNVRLLDLGCGNGNLLYNLRHRFPGFALVGVDLASSLIDSCRLDEDLHGIQFETGDLLELGARGIEPFDIITVNAVLQILNDDELDAAFRSIAAVLKPGGRLINFDGYHPFDQNVAVSVSRPTAPEVHKRLTYHYRGYGFTRQLTAAAGFDEVQFEPFEIPIDLPMSAAAPETTSYTIRAHDGRRVIMIGPVYQPWCFLSARRAATQ